MVLLAGTLLLIEITMTIATSCLLSKQYVGKELKRKVLSRYTSTLIFVFIPQTFSMCFFFLWNPLTEQNLETAENIRAVGIVEASFVFVLLIVRVSEPLVWHSLLKTFFRCCGMKRQR